LSHLHFLTLKMGQIVSPEMLGFNLNQMPGNYPKENNFNARHIWTGYKQILNHLNDSRNIIPPEASCYLPYQWLLL
jgi:hypothetical protein